MGLAPNMREMLRKNFMRSEHFSLSMLHKFVRALSEMAPYQDRWMFRRRTSRDQVS